MDRGIKTTASPDNYTTQPSFKHTPQTNNDDGDGSASAIAAGVTVPVVLILLMAGISYWFYRKKYPVRMIVGRDFAKFSNPAYSRNQSQTHTLVREDADAFFQQTQPTGPVTLVLGDDDEEAKVCYVNTAFEYDSHDADEEEVERRFRQQKSYLFKKHDDLDADDQPDSSTVNGQVGREQAYENVAFSPDSDVDRSSEPNKRDEVDSGSTSSDISSLKPVHSDIRSSQEAPQTVPDAGQQHQPGMTVRDFLLMAKEKRALSDVQRTRADSVTATFEFDINKSARRRAQSAGDIWTSNVQSLHPVSREDLMLSRTGTPPTEGNMAQEIYENAEIPESGKSTEVIGEVSQTEPCADVKKEEELKTSVNEGNMEDSLSAANGTPSGATPSKPDEDQEERNRTESSNSDSSFEKVVPERVSCLESAAKEGVDNSLLAQQGEAREFPQDEETVSTASSTDNCLPVEDEYVNIGRMEHSSPLSAVPETSSDLEDSGVTVDEMDSDDIRQCVDYPAQDAKHPPEVNPENFDEVHLTYENVEVPTSLSTSVVSNISDTPSFEIVEECQFHQQAGSGTSSSEDEPVSPSSSLVMLEKPEAEETKNKEQSVISSFNTGVSFNTKFSTEEDFERVSHDHHQDQHAEDVEQGMSSTSGLPHEQSLPSSAHSDRSSLSSNDSDEPKKEESVGVGPEHKPGPVIHQTISEDEEESAASLQTSTAASHLTSDLGQPSASHSGDHLASGSVQDTEAPSQASSPQGVAALRLHPNVNRRSESDSEGVELTADDIEQILDESDNSAGGRHSPSALQTHAPKTPVKVKPTEKFVFSQEDDEDFDV